MTHFRTLPCADERNVLGVISCVAASWVNVARAATNGTVPPTDAEVIALRQASGDIVGGESLVDISRGSLKRYGWTGTLDESWETIQTGLVSGGMCFAVVGHYSALPARIRNAGQADVLHCVAVLTGAPTSPVLVDSLQKPAPAYVPVTIAEVKAFCATGAYQSLGVREYAHATKHGRVRVRSLLAGPFYTRTPTGWTAGHRGPLNFTADSTLDKALLVLGKTRRMVKLTSGTHRGLWLDIASRGCTYTEEV